MKKITFLILLGFFIFNSCKGQDPEKYNELIAEARNLSEAGEYENSAEKYSEAFAAVEDVDSISHHYEAARALALSGDKESAFEQLFVISGEGEYADLWQISSDKDLNSLRTDERWMTILQNVSKNKKAAEAELTEVASLLETVRYDDQKYRQEMGGIQEKFGNDSEELRSHLKLMKEQDSINLVKVQKVLEEYGWLGWDLIGRNANAALFLVIQHADLETQERYLPMLREAVKRGDATPADLALLEDRVALRQGKKQIYGSQMAFDQETGEYYVSPLEDPDNVNERRAKVGLGPIEDYISNWDLTWDAEAYKKSENSEINIQN